MFDEQASPQVQLGAGPLVGSMAPGAAGETAIRVFKGIPYAAPPVGDLRWKPPLAAQPWQGVRMAQEFSADCPQKSNVGSRAPAQSEDCLYLNVWSPEGAEPGSLPVMVWVHGGSFVAGSGSEKRLDGTLLARENVVVVSINYRVGLFGFLAHPQLSMESPHGVSGNYGLLDKICAFQWIKQNIAAFGGDPDRITAFGVSAGSASLSLLLTSALAKDLFNQAILESPGAGRPLTSMADAEKAGLALGPDIAALRQLSGEEILEMTPLLAPKVRGLTTPRVLRPIRDGWVLAEDERPVFKSGRLHAMPLILGTNADEGTQATSTWPFRPLEQYRELLEPNFGADIDQAMALYPVEADADVAARVAELFGDTQFNYGTRLLAQAMAGQGQPTWRYLFTRRRPNGEEVAYVFGNLDAPYGGFPPDWEDADRKVSTAMMKAWAAFAENGNPNRPGLAAWPAYDSIGDAHMDFGTAIKADSGLRREQLDFLDAFYDKK
jgi:para-nitrobenzyl esterase